ncbi:MAG TPA: efflux RND transporter periplasmic adaptor subunit [Acidiphilium sp.]|uniref:efflux RND transporter periplasmic adaptor subunit n=1 Tax=unclassified Acidiphilium TaxID=2617493 RepID=UPI000BD2AB3F|nr:MULTISPECIES: efflux RND transporter periplasmic adaptor subunit [unclassified Acidiphilium]OYV55782.1 MAG: efflux transporter periplasmic adaptor subunit [Acidiphilium sp. 20-67-58]OYV86968.1 MAG: efflux transporter periplasmic adaptor subunit [Acidiphilium sp. 21-68-69]HQT60276.1 efflux RND transporter periplasmic adaptor subunit [Acidiphilium sp.]HQU12182.1 efflux RND transporter periplasmic adaptor subunit [Acidiphilium sp.]
MRRPFHATACRAAITALVLTLGIGSEAASAAAPPPPVVSVVIVKPRKVYQQDSFIGRIQAAHIVNLVPRVTGYLEQRLFHQGAEVKKGQLLYVIEPGPYQAAFDQAKANVAGAQATLDNAKLTLERAARLLHTPAGRQSTYDDDKAAAESAAAKLQAAEAARETAAINLAYTEIRAPLDGRIGASAVNIGNVVGPNTGTLATVVSQDPMNIVFSMPTRDAIRLGDQLAKQGGLAGVVLRVRLPDGQLDPQKGTLDFTGNQISQSTDSLAMQGSIPNPVIRGAGTARTSDRMLTSGEFVTVIVRSRTPEDKIVLPRDAVLADQVGDYVLTVGKDGKVARDDVKLASTTPATATIASGLAIGAKVIVDGIEKVHPGVKAKAKVIAAPQAQG